MSQKRIALEFWHSPSLQMAHTASSSMGGPRSRPLLWLWKYDSFSSRSMSSSNVSQLTSARPSARRRPFISCSQAQSSSSMSYSTASSSSSADRSMKR